MSKFSPSVLVLTAALSLAMASTSFARPPHDGGPGARDGRPPHHQQHHGQPQRPQPQHHKSQPAPRRDDHHHSHHRTRNAVAAGVAAGAILFGLAELSRSSQQSSSSTYYQQDPATLYQSQGAQVVRYVYWCDEPQGYYPDVRACPTGWRQVPASY